MGGELDRNPFLRIGVPAVAAIGAAADPGIARGLAVGLPIFQEFVDAGERRRERDVQERTTRIAEQAAQREQETFAAGAPGRAIQEVAQQRLRDVITAPEPLQEPLILAPDQLPSLMQRPQPLTEAQAAQPPGTTPTVGQTSQRIQDLLAAPGGQAQFALAGGPFGEAVTAFQTRAQRETQRISARAAEQAAETAATREKRLGEEGQFDVLPGITTRDAAGVERTQWTVIDNRTKLPISVINSAGTRQPEWGALARNVRDLERFKAEGNDAAVAQMQQQMIRKGWRISEGPDGRFMLEEVALGGPNQSVLDQIEDQERRLDLFSRMIESVDALDLQPGDRGAGGFIQRFIGQITQQSSEIGAALSKVTQTMMGQRNLIYEVDDKGRRTGTDLTSRFFNPMIGRERLMFNAMVMLRAGIYGQTGRSMSDKDFERLSAEMRATSFDEWHKVVKPTLLNEIRIARLSNDDARERQGLPRAHPGLLQPTGGKLDAGDVADIKALADQGLNAQGILQGMIDMGITGITLQQIEEVLGAQ